MGLSSPTIDNSGLIRGGQIGINNIFVVTSIASLHLTNSGDIVWSFAVVQTGNAADLITNCGQITGNVNLGGGADRRCRRELIVRPEGQ